jgi:hypothetical protein
MFAFAFVYLGSWSSCFLWLGICVLYLQIWRSIDYSTDFVPVKKGSVRVDESRISQDLGRVKVQLCEVPSTEYQRLYIENALSRIMPFLALF